MFRDGRLVYDGRVTRDCCRVSYLCTAASSKLTSRTSTIPTDAYFVGLMHGIMVHGLGTFHPSLSLFSASGSRKIG
jgi:hypothetical protein